MRVAMIGFLAVLAAPAAAEISMAERLDDCLGPRADALAYEKWSSAPCQEDSSCGPFDAAVYGQPSEVKCPIEAYFICAMRDAEAVEPCLAMVDDLVEARTAGLSTTPLDARVSAALNMATPGQSVMLKGLLGSIEESWDCTSEPLPVPPAITKDRACTIFHKVVRFTVTRQLVRALVRIEKREQE